MRRPESRRQKALKLLRSAMAGPLGVGHDDSADGYVYRAWATTHLLPHIAALNAKEIEGVELPEFVTGAMYEVKV